MENLVLLQQFKNILTEITSSYLYFTMFLYTVSAFLTRFEVILSDEPRKSKGRGIHIQESFRAINYNYQKNSSRSGAFEQPKLRSIGDSAFHSYQHLGQF